MVKTLEYYNLTECCICLEEYEHKSASSRQAAQEANNASVTIFATDGCGHHICQPCMQRYLQEFVNDYRNQNFFAIDCPDMECEKFYRADDIVPRAIRDPKLNNAWWRKAIERSFMEDVVHCPHDGCTSMFEVDDSINQKTFGECPDCHRAMCLYCVNKWHPDKDCPTADSNSSGTSIAERKRQAQREQSVAARKLAEQNGWCRCPKCKQMVVREYGCNTIRCRCGINFCYRCGAKSNDHTCTRKCHTLSEQQLQEIRRPMFEYKNTATCSRRQNAKLRGFLALFRHPPS
ncbi:hypothetical protein VTP01DRAFT_4029 [Rhizomucor pusillus]|uniref:uncharacterized protein n=1 Tax=Rhizomucor pusillus TaxID=4840 RepID=UPI0037437E63